MESAAVNRKHLSIVLASPGDVKRERDLVESVVDEINHGIAALCGLQLDVIRWETDATPGLDLGGSQAAIDKKLRVEDRDLLIGIFWKKFGTPVSGAASGTEHEIRSAVTAWEKRKRPQVFIYFSSAPYSPTGQDYAQGALIQKFKDEYATSRGLYWSYGGADEFERIVRRHLTDFVRDHIDRTYGVREVVDSLEMYRELGHLGVSHVAFANSGHGQRIADYQRLRDEAVASVLIMGIGLTVISQYDREVIRHSVERGLKVRLLMLDPSVVVPTIESAAAGPLAVSHAEFDAFYDRYDYGHSIVRSMKELLGFISNLRGVPGRIELRTYAHWTPMNFTAIDEQTPGARAILEFCMPFSQDRVRISLGTSGNRSDLLERCIATAERLWGGASTVASYVPPAP